MTITLQEQSLIAILTEDAFLREQAERRVVELRADERAVFFPERHDVAEVEMELLTPPFLSEKKLVTIRELHRAKKEWQQGLIPLLSSIPFKVTLLLVADSLDRRSKLYKVLSKEGMIYAPPEVKPWQQRGILLQWLSSEAAARGKKLESDAQNLLLDQCGLNRLTLSSELDKLSLYALDRPAITAKDVAALSSVLATDNVWELGRMIFERNFTKAWRAARALLTEGGSPIALIAGLRKQFQTDYEVCLVVASGQNPAELSEKFPYMKGRILQEHVRLATAYGEKGFRLGLVSLAEAEERCKSGSADDVAILEWLIIRLASGQRVTPSPS